MPFLASVSARQSGFVLANAAKLDAPTFGASTSTSGGYTFSISNYNALNTYSFSVTDGGSATQTSGTVTVTGLGSNVTATCQVTVSRAGFISNSASTTGTSFTQLATPTLAAATSEVLAFTVVITNYDASYTYTLSTTSGSATRSGSTITNTVPTNNASATVSVTASKAGFTTSGTATRTGTAVPGCTYTGSYSTINGGNCGTCGIICCTNGVPAYDTVWYTYTPYPCANGTTKVTGDVGVNGGWYCLTTGTGSGLSCGPGTPCGGSNGC